MLSKVASANCSLMKCDGAIKYLEKLSLDHVNGESTQGAVVADGELVANVTKLFTSVIHEGSLCKKIDVVKNKLNLLLKMFWNVQENCNYLLTIYTYKKLLKKIIKRSKHCLAWLVSRKVNLKLTKLNNVLRHFCRDV
jgi:hypothetical protein